MEAKLKSMYSNKVKNLIEAHEEIKPIGCKWVYNMKRGVDGKVEIYKARLVGNDYNQKLGFNCDETFLLVSMLKYIRILLSLWCISIMRYEKWMS